jgi:hypothetical protein
MGTETGKLEPAVMHRSRTHGSSVTARHHNRDIKHIRTGRVIFHPHSEGWLERGLGGRAWRRPTGVERMSENDAANVGGVLRRRTKANR